MYKEVLVSIEGIEIYPVISLLIFFTLFAGLTIWTFLADGDRLERLARLPLDDNDDAGKPSAPAGRNG